MRFIGDIHTKIDEYISVATQAPQSIQVGDFGIGMLSQYKQTRLSGFQDLHGQKHRFIRGNHDDPDACIVEPTFIHDGHMDHRLSILSVGGAQSWGVEDQVAGFDWWPNEELDDASFDQILTSVLAYKPRVIVSHDAPYGVLREMFYRGTHKPITKNRTNANLQRIFEQHQPEYWVFGHWHLHRREVIEGTEFICLEELQHIDIDLEVLNEEA